jgi:hypothetical protein
LLSLRQLARHKHVLYFNFRDTLARLQDFENIGSKMDLLLRTPTVNSTG